MSGELKSPPEDSICVNGRAEPACDSVQGATASLAFTATMALWNL